jgi:AraC family ethanolamine operon transcriptional activator
MEDLAAYFEREQGPRLDKVVGGDPTVINLDPAHLQALRTHLRRVSFDYAALQQSLVLLDGYRDKLYALLLAVFNGREEGIRQRDARSRKRLLSEVFKWVERHRDEDLSLQALCTHLDVPERTLSGVFRRELGMSPAAFVKGYRLFGVHRSLWQVHPAQARVTDIANAWGFWHMGQFAADYRKFFGELPRQTLARSPVNS